MGMLNEFLLILDRMRSLAGVTRAIPAHVEAGS
jgi:hypothetical protein